MSKIGQDVSQVSLQGLGRAHHWSQAGVRGPEIPTAKVVRRPLRIAISPERAQRFLDRPGASGFQVLAFDRLKLRPTPLRYILFIRQPEVLGALQPFVAS